MVLGLIDLKVKLNTNCAIVKGYSRILQTLEFKYFIIIENFPVIYYSYRLSVYCKALQINPSKVSCRCD